MTDAELIDLVYEKSPDEFSTEELGLLRVRMHDSNEIRLALKHRVQLEQGLVETLQAPPLPVAQILSTLTSGGVGGAAVQSLIPSVNGRGAAELTARETVRKSAASIAPRSSIVTWATRACVTLIVASAVVVTAVVVERAVNGPPNAQPPAGAQPAPAQPSENDPLSDDPTRPGQPPEEEDDERSPSDAVPPGFK
jgi:hypothetical protein